MPNTWLRESIARLGLSAGDVVLVHTSMKGLGHIHGGPDAVIDALLSIVGENGTVLFPTLTGSGDNGPVCPPGINLSSTPCANWVGVLPEVARQRPGAVRSIHPTHSVVALGANQQKWTSGHQHGRSPSDQHSPYFRLMNEGGKILLLGGVTHDSNTSLHCIEEIAGVPYHLQEQKTDGVVSLADGSDVVVSNHLHLWRNRYHHLGWSRDFTVVAELLLAAGAQTSVFIGNSMSTLVDAAAMREVLLPLIEQDPLYLMTRGGFSNP